MSKNNKTVSQDTAIKKNSLGQELIHLPKEAGSLLVSNVRDYAMYIALILIFIVFNIQSGGVFLSASNISNLINQTGYVAVLAIGMTLILIIRHIDLSVGFVAAFTGAISALLMKHYGAPWWLAILAAVGVGAIVGLYQGFLVAYLKVPAFVTTLAGMFIFRGLLNLSLQKDGTIIVASEKYKSLAGGYIPDISSIGKVIDYHFLTLLIGGITIALLIISQIRVRANKKKYNFSVVSTPLFVLGIAISSAVVVAIILLLASYNGLPWAAVIVAIILFIYNLMLNKTSLGRYIYGIGGNPEATELSGVNVKKITLMCFVSMSTLAAVAGVLYTSRIGSAAPSAGVGFELDAIASAYIGGVAVSGGVGKVTNTIIGALVITSLTSGFNLQGVDIAFQYIAKGIIFIIAVAFDVISRRGGSNPFSMSKIKGLFTKSSKA